MHTEDHAGELEQDKGIVMTVFGMSAAFISTCRYPFFKSIFEKWVHPAALVVKSSMFGIGYLSSTVMLLRRR